MSQFHFFATSVVYFHRFVAISIGRILHNIILGLGPCSAISLIQGSGRYSLPNKVTVKMLHKTVVCCCLLVPLLSCINDFVAVCHTGEVYTNRSDKCSYLLVHCEGSGGEIPYNLKLHSIPIKVSTERKTPLRSL